MAISSYIPFMWMWYLNIWISACIKKIPEVSIIIYLFNHYLNGNLNFELKLSAFSFSPSNLWLEFGMSWLDSGSQRWLQRDIPGGHSDRHLQLSCHRLNRLSVSSCIVSGGFHWHSSSHLEKIMAIWLNYMEEICCVFTVRCSKVEQRRRMLRKSTCSTPRKSV